MTVKKKAKQQSRNLVGVVYIKSTFNNTIVSITDSSGHVLSRINWDAGFKEV